MSGLLAGTAATVDRRLIEGRIGDGAASGEGRAGAEAGGVSVAGGVGPSKYSAGPMVLGSGEKPMGDGTSVGASDVRESELGNDAYSSGGEWESEVLNASGDDTSGVLGRVDTVNDGVRLRPGMLRAGERGGRITGLFSAISLDDLLALLSISPANVDSVSAGRDDGLKLGSGTLAPAAFAASRSVVFSPSTTRSAARSASFCLRDSTSSSALSAAFIRSCATILFASSKSAWLSCSSSASSASFSPLASFNAVRSASSALFSSSIRLSEESGTRLGMLALARWFCPRTRESELKIPPSLCAMSVLEGSALAGGWGVSTAAESGVSGWGEVTGVGESEAEIRFRARSAASRFTASSSSSLFACAIFRLDLARVRDVSSSVWYLYADRSILDYISYEVQYMVLVGEVADKVA